MGASQSTSAVNVINKAIVDVIITNANNGSSAISQNQNITINGNVSGSNFTQYANVSVQSLQSVKINNKICDQIANKILQEAAANGIAMGAYTGSDAQTNISNYIKTKISDSDIQNCAASVNQNQKITVGSTGNLNNSNITQTACAFAKCFQTTLNSNGVAQGLLNSSKNTSKSKTSNPLNFLSSMMSYIVIGIIAFIVLIIIVGMMLFKGTANVATTELGKN